MLLTASANITTVFSLLMKKTDVEMFENVTLGFRELIWEGE